MSDPRQTPANDRVALTGTAAGPGVQAVDGTPAAVCLPLADLRRSPGGARDRQLLMGEAVRVLETLEGWSFVQAGKDGYVGYVRAEALGPAVSPTHIVSVPATHLYEAADVKAPETHALSFGSRLVLVAETRAHFETAEGAYVPKPHVRPLDRPFRDPVTVAQFFFGTPYLWGGNSVWGIDCSGLVQAAFLACGRDCPGDSDQQCAALGPPVAPETRLARGDLLFWDGHVAIAVDGDTLLHANAHHMAVAYEGAAGAIRRIELQGDGPVTAHLRP